MKTCQLCKLEIKAGQSFAEIEFQKFIHATCFKCSHCKLPLPADYTLDKEGNLFHIECLDSIQSKQLPSCYNCRKKIGGNDTAIKAQGSVYHVQCFKCSACDKPLKDRYYLDEYQNLYDIDCYQAATAPKCVKCKKSILIDQKFTTYLGEKYHAQCFHKCSECNGSLVDGSRQFREVGNGKLTCNLCVQKSGPQNLFASKERSEINKELQCIRSQKDVLDNFGKTYGSDASQESSVVSGKTKDLLEKLNSVKSPVSQSSMRPLLTSTHESQQDQGQTQKISPNGNGLKSNLPVKQQEQQQNSQLYQDQKLRMSAVPAPPPSIGKVSNKETPKAPLTPPVQDFQSLKMMVNQPTTQIPGSLLAQIRSTSIDNLTKLSDGDVRDASTPAFLRSEQDKDSSLKSSLSKSLSKMNLQEDLQQALTEKRNAMASNEPEEEDW